MEDDGMAALTPRLAAMTRMQSLNLDSNKLGYLGVRALSDALQNMAGLRVLALCDNQISMMSARA
jgi:Ran GTPase-activating protein (RanGAP) involved in mRNA processing and transport